MSDPRVTQGAASRQIPILPLQSVAYPLKNSPVSVEIPRARYVAV
jgi:hypothetical protein